MTLDLVETVSDAQRGLAAALDTGTAKDVHAATECLARAVRALRAAGAWRATPELKTLLVRALREGEAARVRTFTLADHASRRLDHLKALSGRTAQRYGRQGRYL